MLLNHEIVFHINAQSPVKTFFFIWQYVGYMQSSTNQQSLWVLPGFQTLTDVRFIKPLLLSKASTIPATTGLPTW